ncbi:MAG: hypothetical protein C4342_00470 [Armatimonadota bacterium]
MTSTVRARRRWWTGSSRATRRPGGGWCGVARATAGRLGQQGYRIQRTDTAREASEVSRVVYKQAAFEARAREIQQFLGIAELHKDPDHPEEADVIVTIGKDLGQRMLASGR